MILSASRRTDIPAFYSGWLMNRLREGFVLVRNPMNPSRVSRVEFTPDTADCLVFWSKNPEPMMEHLDEIDRLGYRYYFQFTLTPYGRTVERGLPDKGLIVKTFQELSRRVGRERIVWRYDPVILNGRFSAGWHFQAFEALCKSLGGFTDECVFSFLDVYAKTRRNMRGLMPDEGISAAEMEEIAGGFARIAGKYGILLKTCSEAIDLASYGIGHASCIDKERIERIAGCKIRAAKDKNQRPECRCIESIDIGAYNSCRHGCLYCYATWGDTAAAGNYARHDENSPLLIGHLLETDEITRRETASFREAPEVQTSLPGWGKKA